MPLLDDLTAALLATEDRRRTELLSAALAPVVPHRALALLVGSCARSPLNSSGEDGVADRITGADLARLEAAVPASAEAWLGEVEIAGETRPVAAVAEAGESTSLLVLVLSDPEPLTAEQLETLRTVWTLFTVSTLRTIDRAGPGDLSASRAAAGERARVTAELADPYEATLAGLLGTLRARHLDDRAARRTAIDLAATALVELRVSVARERDLGDEPVADAFKRLRTELTPLARSSTARLELVAPTGEVALAAPIAQAARAITRGAVLSLLEQPDVRRLRVAWRLGRVLTIDIRDDGPGEPTGPAAIAGSLREHAEALGGSLELESVPGWGTQLFAELPLGDATGVDGSAPDPLAALRPRELEVLAELTRGLRNREIAEKLSISENTVKFHVAKVLAKLDVGTRGQAALIARDSGLVPRDRVGVTGLEPVTSSLSSWRSPN